MGRYSGVAPPSPLHEGNEPYLALGAASRALSPGQDRARGALGDRACLGAASEQSCGEGTGTATDPAPIFSLFPKEAQRRGACSPLEPSSLRGGLSGAASRVRAGTAGSSLTGSPHASTQGGPAPDDRPRPRPRRRPLTTGLTGQPRLSSPESRASPEPQTRPAVPAALRFRRTKLPGRSRERLRPPAPSRASPPPPPSSPPPPFLPLLGTYVARRALASRGVARR